VKKTARKKKENKYIIFGGKGQIKMELRENPLKNSGFLLAKIFTSPHGKSEKNHNK
jgi:hypothetical protein